MLEVTVRQRDVDTHVQLLRVKLRVIGGGRMPVVEGGRAYQSLKGMKAQATNMTRESATALREIREAGGLVEAKRSNPSWRGRQRQKAAQTADERDAGGAVHARHSWDDCACATLYQPRHSGVIDVDLSTPRSPPSRH